MGEVTLDRLAEGIRRAHAAGDIDTVKKLGGAYRQMQGQADGAAKAPDGLKPGSKQYALWARDAAIAGKTLPQVSEMPPEPQMAQPNTDLGSKMHAAAGSFIEGMPIAGPMLVDLAQQARAGVQGMPIEDVRREFTDAKEANPISSTVGGIAGGVATLAPLGMTALGGRLLGTAGSLPQQLAMSSLSGAGISGADTLARGGTAEDAFKSAAIGAGLGTIFPAAGAVKNAIGNRAAQTAAVSAAIKNAPSSAELKNVASALFKEVDSAGVTVNTPEFSKLVADLATKAKKMRINPNLDPKATGAFQELIGALDDVQKSGGSLTVSDLHTLRQIAQKAATSAEGRDAFFANTIVDGLDDFVTKPIATVLPANRLGTGTTGGGDTLKEAIAAWGRARRVGVVEEAIEKARNAASGFENGLRGEFRKILNNKKLRGQFDKTELTEMARVVQGTSGANMAKLIGKFGFGPGANGLGGFLGGTAGLTFGGPLGAVAASAGASGARKLSEKLTEAAAERAAKVVATPNIPVLAPRNPQGLIPGATLPLELTKKREPLFIEVRGGR